MGNAYKDAAINMGRMVGDSGIHGDVKGRRDAKKKQPPAAAKNPDPVEPDHDDKGATPPHASASAPPAPDRPEPDEDDKPPDVVSRMENSFKPKSKRSVHLGGPSSFGNKRR